MEWPDGTSVPIIETNGLYYVRAVCSKPAVLTVAASEANLTTADDAAMLWAARTYTDSAGLLSLARTVNGINITRISPKAAEAINHDTYRRISVSRKKYTGSTPASHKAMKPGQGFIVDGFGTHSAPSPIDGAVYSFHAICDLTSYGYAAATKTHTSRDWIRFLASVKTHAKAATGNDMLWVVFDMAPELRSEGMKEEIERELGIHVYLAARRQHESVGLAEVNNDILTRMAEADLQRARRGTAFLLPARCYAQYRLNRKHKRGDTLTRFQRYYGRHVDLAGITPYLWGTRVLAHETKEGRGPKGSLDKPRAIEGTLMGIDGSSYLVLKTGGGLLRAGQVDPLDEMQLMRRGLQSGAASADADTQTDITDVFGRAPPPHATTADTQPKPLLDLPVGSRVTVTWLSPTGQPKDYPGTVTELSDDGRRRLWEVEHDGHDERSRYNFDTTKRKWKRLDADDETTHDDETPTPPADPHTDGIDNRDAVPRITRAQARRAMAHFAQTVKDIDNAMNESHEPRMVECFHAAVYQHMGTSGLHFTDECETPRDVEVRLTEMHLLAHGLADGNITKETLSAVAHRAATAEAIIDAQDAPIDLEAFAAEVKAGRAAGEIMHANARAVSSVDKWTTPARSQRLVCSAIDFVTAQLECNKASQEFVDVTTELGTVRYHVPKNKKEFDASTQKEQWYEASRQGLQAILAGSGNRLVPVSVPQGKGVPIGRVVTTSRIKIDQATGQLTKNWAKVRHALDGGFLPIQFARMSTLRNSADQPDDSDTPASATVSDDMLVKMALADAAVRDLNLTKGDIGDAYLNGTRTTPLGYMALPSTLPMYDDDGTPMCIELATPLWGERAAGYEWQCAFNECLEKMGWRPAENVPAMFIIETPAGTARMLTVVDDFLITESGGTTIADATIAALKVAFGKVTFEHEPESFVGYKITRDRPLRTLTISMPQKVEEAVAQHAPHVMDAAKSSALSGKKLADAADALVMPARESGAKLSKRQTQTQQIIGSLKFVEKCMPRLSLPLHRLSCIMSYPPPEAYDVAVGLLAVAYRDRDVGITFSGGGPDDGARLQGALAANILDDPAPAALEASADATWGDRNIYSLLVTYGRGCVAHSTKKLSMILDSSMEAEAIGSSKTAEVISYAREILRALGVPATAPTVVMTDNKANLLVAKDLASASRSRHFLRRYWALQQRMKRGEVRLVKVPDPDMPADFLTKWVPSAKLAKSIEYATNSRSRDAGTFRTIVPTNLKKKIGGSAKPA